jgi:hypothetical protein
MARVICKAQYNIPCGVNPPHSPTLRSRHVHVLHVATGTDLGTDVGFETAAVLGWPACTGFETGIGADAEIDGKTVPEAGLVTRAGALPANPRNKSTSVSDFL